MGNTQDTKDFDGGGIIHSVWGGLRYALRRTDVLPQIQSGLWPAVVAHQDSEVIEFVSNRHLQIAGARGQDSSKEAPTFESRATDPIAQEIYPCSPSNDGPSHTIRKIVQVDESSATIVTNSCTSHASVAAFVEAHFPLHLGPGVGKRHSE